MLNLETQLLQLGLPHLIRVFLSSALLHRRRVHFVRTCLTKGFWYTILFVEVLTADTLEGLRIDYTAVERDRRTISPSIRTFSPRTKKIPL